MANSTKTSSIDSSFPSLLPEDELLTLNSEAFEQSLIKTLKQSRSDEATATAAESLKNVDLNAKTGKTLMEALETAEPTPKVSDTAEELAKHNKTLTENADVTFISTNSPLLDLFVELGRDISGPRLEELLDSAWKVNSLATLKIVWNARSIHLGKGGRDCFYKALGWFSENHPATLLLNLQWLVRRVIKLNPEKAKDELVMVEMDDAATLTEELETLHGGSHGYFKDLLNLLVLAANGSLDANHNPRKTLHAKNPHTKKRRCPFPPITAGKHGKVVAESELRSVEQCKQLAKEEKHRKESENWNRAAKNLQDPFYRYLHATVARTFAEQLEIDLERLNSGRRDQIEKITLAAKWAPSLQGFHDKHTIIASSIAEILFPRSSFDPQVDRTMYLKLAREAYRAKYLTPLRAHLDVVERKITKQMFGDINYSKVPSLAMDKYKNLFIRKDLEHYAKYIEKVSQGKAKISGAVLTPATLIHQVMANIKGWVTSHPKSVKEVLAKTQSELLRKTADGQWKTMVDRIKQSGKLSSTIAVVDVSGSMYSPTFHDGTTPIDSAMGLGMLVAEVTSEPFGGSIITFSANPKVQKIDLTSSLEARILRMIKYEWGMNTDFVAVFERLILPMAIKDKIAPEDMVKQVIVFSDMQFDQAQSNHHGHGTAPSNWESSFDRIKRRYAEAGYEMPLLVFWNLAAQKAGGSKPVTKNECNTMLVSGYSQAMLKMFLDNGGFEGDSVDEDEDEDLEEVVLPKPGDDAATITTKKAKKKVDPEAGMWKAIGHEAYAMLQVYD